MTKEILEKVNEGVIPDNKELNIAIKFYEDLCSKTKLLGDKYHLFWLDSFHTLNTLQGFKRARNDK